MNVRVLVWVAALVALAVGLPSAVAAPGPGSHFAQRSRSLPGDQLWASRYNGGYGDRPSALGVSPDGSRVFVTGSSTGSGSPDYATVAYDVATGAQIWASRYDGPAHGGWDNAAALAVSPDGSKVFVTGFSQGSSSNGDYATIAYDAATGGQLWLRRYDGPSSSNDSASAVAVSPDGSKVFVTGFSYAGDTDYATIAYDVATGAQLWLSRYDGPAPGGGDLASDVAVSPDGSRVFVTGQSAGATSYDYATIAYDAATGAQLWASRYDGPAGQADLASALGVSPDGSKLFVTGQSTGSGSYDYATVAYDAATGAQLWLRRYRGPAHGADAPPALAVSPDGSKVFAAGQTSKLANNDYATVAYDAATGAQLWLRLYDGPAHGSDAARALGISPDGSKLFVTGQSAGSTNNDYATVSYDAASGDRLWATRYRVGDATAVADLGVRPDGSALFVTGSSSGSGTGYDYVTVAYSTG